MRMRPLNKDEQEGEMIVQKVANDSLSIGGHTFSFDSIADFGSTQVIIIFCWKNGLDCSMFKNNMLIFVVANMYFTA